MEVIVRELGISMLIASRQLESAAPASLTAPESPDPSEMPLRMELRSSTVERCIGAIGALEADASTDSQD
jgi:hypothetical protein